LPRGRDACMRTAANLHDDLIHSDAGQLALAEHVLEVHAGLAGDTLTRLEVPDFLVLLDEVVVDGVVVDDESLVCEVVLTPCDANDVAKYLRSQCTTLVSVGTAELYDELSMPLYDEFHGHGSVLVRVELVGSRHDYDQGPERVLDLDRGALCCKHFG
jgi:hypothetical protein